VIEDREGEQEKEDSQRRENSERYVNAAVKFLPGAAVWAFSKVLFVVFAHLRINSGDVIAPTCENGAHDSVSALGSCHIQKDSLCKGCVPPPSGCAAHVANEAPSHLLDASLGITIQ
jgi:hypothetical protein